MNEEDFWKIWKLEWIEQVKIGDKVVSEVKFAVHKDAKAKAWELLSKSLSNDDLENIGKMSNEFEFTTDNSSLVWRLVKNDKRI